MCFKPRCNFINDLATCASVNIKRLMCHSAESNSTTRPQQFYEVFWKIFLIVSSENKKFSHENDFFSFIFYSIFYSFSLILLFCIKIFTGFPFLNILRILSLLKLYYNYSLFAMQHVLLYILMGDRIFKIKLF